MSDGQVADNLYEVIRQMLWEDWDPIGVNQFSEAADEYDGYVPEVVNLVLNNASQEEMLEYLWAMETGHIGLEGDRENTTRFAEKLAALAASRSSTG